MTGPKLGNYLDKQSVGAEDGRPAVPEDDPYLNRLWEFHGHEPLGLRDVKIESKSIGLAIAAARSFLPK